MGRLASCQAFNAFGNNSIFLIFTATLSHLTDQGEEALRFKTGLITEFRSFLQNMLNVVRNYGITKRKNVALLNTKGLALRSEVHESTMPQELSRHSRLFLESMQATRFLERLSTSYHENTQPVLKHPDLSPIF
ncbi:hypothetical protein MRX96_042858 [Rhipicephalus microplus]